MIALKKVYGEELLRLALLLSLLKADPSTFIEQEAERITAGLPMTNGSDWSFGDEASSFTTPRVHPKTLDNVIMDYERRFFEELNSLGRYYTNYADEHNERILNTNELRPVVQTYVLNNLTTVVAQPFNDNTVYVEPPDIHDGVSDDANVGQEVKIENESTEDEIKIESLTISDDYFGNRTVYENLDEIGDRVFDVSEFFAQPEAMQIKKEKDDTIKTEPQPDDILSAIADKPSDYDLFSEVDSVYNTMDDIEETIDAIREFRMSFESIDPKNGMDYDRYLMENIDLDEEVYLKGIKIEVKRERASTSFTSAASSSGVSDCYGDICSDDAVGAYEEYGDIKVKEEPRTGGELSQEDVDIIEVLWKQDVDMGYSLDKNNDLPCEKTVQGYGCEATEPMTEADFKEKCKTTQIVEKKKIGDDSKPINDKDVENKTASDVDPWAGLSYVVDTETGEYTLQGDLPSELVAGGTGTEQSGTSGGGFNLLEEALKLIESVDEPEKQPRDDDTPASDEVCIEQLGGRSTGAEEFHEQPAAMLHPPRPHPHHAHLYHHQSLMRQMSAEQRWQDLASLLAGPPPPPDQQHHYHQHYGAVHHPHHVTQQTAAGPAAVMHAPAAVHHHNIIGPSHPSHAGVHHGHPAAGHPYPNYGHMPPPPPGMDKHQDAYCGAAMEPEYKMESHNTQHEAMYYQTPQADMSGTADGFLTSILNDEDLQLMDMAVNEGMYPMRMLDSAVIANQHPASLPGHTYTQINERLDSASDSALSSMGSERVASLSDGEWGDAANDGGSDSAHDFHGSKFRPYDATSGYSSRMPDRAGPSAPQKKHHMFGKRCIQENVTSPSEQLHLEARNQRPAMVKYEYTEMTPAQHFEPGVQHNEYVSRLESPGSHAIQQNQVMSELQHAMPHQNNLLQGSSNGVVMGRYPLTPCVDRIKHNHTYSGGTTGIPNRPHSRDKKVRRLTDGNSSDTSSTAGHMSRDEKRAKALGIPIEVSEIINLPMDEFNERLSKHDLSETQLSLIRDIRRRGKNKVAAQNCRKRKLEQITSLADEVIRVRERKTRLSRERHHALLERQRLKDRFAALYAHVFQHLRDSEGRPVSSSQYSLQQAADGSVVLVPKIHNSTDPIRSSDEDMDRKKSYEP